VTFSTPSTSTSDYKTVTAECGNTVTANVLVCNVEITASGDYIVPGSSLNTIRYVVSPSGFPATVKMEVKNSSGTVVRTLTGLPTSNESSGYAQYQWDGNDDSGDPLTEKDSAYTVRLIATQGNLECTDKVDDRQVEEWTMTLTLRDIPAPGTDYASGIDEDTVTTDLFIVKAQPAGGTLTTMTYYDITADTGTQARDCDVGLMVDTSTYYVFYTTPTTDGLPEIKYTMDLKVLDGGVLDLGKNEWDMDPDQDGRQTHGTWTFKISSAGTLTEFEESYE
jgi:hypothetical protein